MSEPVNGRPDDVQTGGAPPPYGTPPVYGTPPAPPRAAASTVPAAAGRLSPTEERQWGMLAHLITLGAWVLSGGFLGFVGALVVYLMFRDRSDFVRAHAANALNVQIVTAIGVVVSFVLFFVLIGFVTMPVVLLYALVVHVVGAVKANNGERWRPPLLPRLVR